ncbi:MAG TPA: glycosyltransferase family 2 protein, partial [Chitinophagaceae bacterium]|nr:glycosyltransferase family 2 protein [Chitinophagaceae bacterium]
MQSNSPLVTVGIPTYNRPKGLERTLQCMLSQTYRNIRVIISDNCSTDHEVLTVLQKYAANDARVKYFVQEKNLSIVPNFQFLLKEATGDYFMWAADDDNWDPNFIETCVTALEEKKDVILCMTDLKLTFEDGSSRQSDLKRSFMQRNLFSRCFHFLKSKLEHTYFFCGMYRLSLIKKLPFDNSWGGDQLFTYEALVKGKFLYVPGKSNFYYYRGGSSKGMDSVRKAFNIKNRFYFFDAYVLRYTTYQFRFGHIGFGKKMGLFFTNWAGLVLNEDFILYFILIKKPIKRLLG